MKVLAIVLALSAGLTAVAAAPTKATGDTGSHLVRRNYTEDTSNQLTDGTACRDVTVIYARGTSQAGNVGVTTDVGLETFNNLAAIIGEDNLALQGVTYPASVAGFEEGGDPTGSQLMANLTALASTQCPETKLVLSGYSQGGQLVHNAAKLISTEVTDFVTGVLIYGDPDNGDAVGSIPSSKVKVICHPLDGICLGTGIVTPAHLTYQDNALEGAQWVASAVGL